MKRMSSKILGLLLLVSAGIASGAAGWPSYTYDEELSDNSDDDTVESQTSLAAKQFTHSTPISRITTRKLVSADIRSAASSPASSLPARTPLTAPGLSLSAVNNSAPGASTPAARAELTAPEGEIKTKEANAKAAGAAAAHNGHSGSGVESSSSPAAGANAVALTMASMAIAGQPTGIRSDPANLAGASLLQAGASASAAAGASIAHGSTSLDASVDAGLLEDIEPLASGSALGGGGSGLGAIADPGNNLAVPRAILNPSPAARASAAPAAAAADSSTNNHDAAPAATALAKAAAAATLPAKPPKVTAKSNWFSRTWKSWNFYKKTAATILGVVAAYVGIGYGVWRLKYNKR
jgi:hypothetical protein